MATDENAALRLKFESLKGVEEDKNALIEVLSRFYHRLMTLLT